MLPWRSLNRAAYAAYDLVRNRSVERAARRWRARAKALADGPERGVLLIAWGRIGDTLLSTGLLGELRTLFPGQSIRALGRGAVRPLVEPFVDEFLAFDTPDETALTRALAGRYECVLGDVHLFYGGTRALGDLIEALPARRKFSYAGYHTGPGLLPWPHAPRGVTVIGQLPIAADAALTDRHLLHHNAHYARALATELGIAAPPPNPIPTLPLSPDRDGIDGWLAEHALLRGGYVALQLSTNNSKKDYPLAHWHEVLRAFPDETFVVLGTARERDRAAELREAARDVEIRDLCGTTDLERTAGVIAAARAFVGPDSGLTHLAALAGQRTVCIAQSANLGYFFPYPQGALPEDNLRTVHHPDYTACAGCFMTCEHESLARTWRDGARCIRTLPATLVVDALRSLLRERASAATPAPGF